MDQQQVEQIVVGFRDQWAAEARAVTETALEQQRQEAETAFEFQRQQLLADEAERRRLLEEQIATASQFVEQAQFRVQQAEQRAQASAPSPGAAPSMRLDNEERSQLKAIIDPKLLERFEKFDGLDQNWQEWCIGFEATGELVGITELLETCLLYTSPSPRDLSTSRMPSSA